MLSSFLVDLLAEVIGDVDVGDVSIVHDAPRLPSESLRNINRRAMGMADSHGPICLKTERKEKKNRWEGLVGAVPKLAFQDPASTKKPITKPGLGRRQCSDSMLLRPTRRPSSPNSPTRQLGGVLTSEGLGGGRTARTRNLHQWGSSSVSCLLNEEVTPPQQGATNGAAASKFMTRERDRRTLTRHLREASLCNAEWSTGRPENNEAGRYSLL
jgi:hypothetical protein